MCLFDIIILRISIMEQKFYWVGHVTKVDASYYIYSFLFFFLSSNQLMKFVKVVHVSWISGNYLLSLSFVCFFFFFNFYSFISLLQLVSSQRQILQPCRSLIYLWSENGISFRLPWFNVSQQQIDDCSYIVHH